MTDTNTRLDKLESQVKSLKKAVDLLISEVDSLTGERRRNLDAIADGQRRARGEIR